MSGWQYFQHMADIGVHGFGAALDDWLNAWVHEMATRRMLFSRFQVMLANGGLRRLGWGEALDVWRHHPAVEIKGATYTELRVWHAQCVVDV